jgi:hypothetical protein
MAVSRPADQRGGGPVDYSFRQSRPVAVVRMRRRRRSLDDRIRPATGVGTIRAPAVRSQETCPATPFAPDAAASTASQPAFVTTAKRPFAGWDVASDSADFPDGLSKTFFAEGLDSPNHLEMPAKISLYAHWIFDPICGKHAPHLASGGFIEYELIASIELWGFPVGVTTRFFCDATGRLEC